VLGALLRKITAGEITTKSGREVFEALLSEADAGSEINVNRIDQIIAERDLALVTDTAELEAAIDGVIARNQKAVEAFKGGKQAAVGPLIGQVMREVKGADPKLVRELLVKKLVD
jgi:aspartyl-tRNA(Asn)/glutamyl-tRNA(Gln) amidotransferase subunit B